MANSIDQDQTPQNAISDQSLHCLHRDLKFLKKHDNNKNYPDTPYIGNGPDQRVKLEEFTWHKWVKVLRYLFTGCQAE